MRVDESLRYLATRDVENVAGRRQASSSSPSTSSSLGRLDGFMVNPEQQTLRYYVVSRFGERSLKQGLVPFVPGLP